MRTRWLVLGLGLSIATNVVFAVALWVSWHGSSAASATLGAACSAPLCDEERRVREELANSLCASVPDRATIEATLARLDAVRAGQRREIVDQWLVRCSKAGAGERATLATSLKQVLCPWQGGKGEACCSPSSTPGARPDNPKQHGQS